MEDLNVYTKIKQLKADWMMRCVRHGNNMVPDFAFKNCDNRARNNVRQGMITEIKCCVAELEASFGTLIDNVEKQLKE